MIKNKISKNWLNKQKRDSFFKQSKIQGYRSRSAFKLIEINDKYKFLKKNTNLLDLGSTPGGWSQVASKKITKGKILAVDINPMEEINNVNFIQGDLFTDKTIKDKVSLFFNGKIDVVMSDIAVKTSGNKDLDSFRTGDICLQAMDLSLELLHEDGVFLSKLFMGSIFMSINEKAKKNFKKIVRYKPLSSKKESKEIYIYCKGLVKV